MSNKEVKKAKRPPPPPPTGPPPPPTGPPPPPPTGPPLNQLIQIALGSKYVRESHSILNPGFNPPPDGDPNEAVKVANNYISVAQNISQIQKYTQIQGVKTAVSAIKTAAGTFNTELEQRRSNTIKANIIETRLGGGKRKRNKKIGTKKKQYKRK